MKLDLGFSDRKKEFIEKTRAGYKEFFNPSLIVKSEIGDFYKVSFMNESLVIYFPYKTVKRHEQIIDQNSIFLGDIFFISEGYLYIKKNKVNDEFMKTFNGFLRYDVEYKDNEDGYAVSLSGGKDLEWIISNPDKDLNGNLVYRLSFISIAPKYYAPVIKPDHVLRSWNYSFGLAYANVFLKKFSPKEKDYFLSKLNGYSIDEEDWQW